MFALLAKQVMELLGSSQSTFGDMVSELGLSAAMRPKAEYTLLAPVNSAFTSKDSFSSLTFCFFLIFVIGHNDQPECDLNATVVQSWKGPTWQKLSDESDGLCFVTHKCKHTVLLSLQLKWCPWIKGCSRSSWRITSWKTKWSLGSCTTDSSWRPLPENIWGSSSIAQCVHFLNPCPDAAVVSRYGDASQLKHEFATLWRERFGSLLLTWGFLSQAVCIENSCLIRGSKEGSDGALHLMSNLMKPAEKTMYEILMENGGFKWVQTIFFCIYEDRTKIADQQENPHFLYLSI